MSARHFLVLRALAAFAALPGLVAFAVPVSIGASGRTGLRYPLPATAVLCAGTLLLLWCVREFYVAGRGTLAPWDPPQHLVTSGPYRLSRNPMYLGVDIVLAGWCLLWASPTLLVYFLAFAIGFHFRVILFEEPWARRRFEAQWDEYRTRVPRWLF